MRLRITWLCGIFLVAVMAVGSNGSAQSGKDSLTLAKLERQIAALEVHVAQLEDSVGELKAHMATLAAERSGVQQAAGVDLLPIPVPRRLDDASSRRIPDDWKRGEINGVPFYTLPLSQQDKTE